MCGRYLLVKSTKELTSILQQLESKTNISYQTNEVFPSHTVPIIISVESKIKIALAKWGFSNGYNKSIVINARSETIFEKPMFKNSIIHSRCVIPISGFYEWKKITENQKQKFYFTNSDFSTMYLAATYKIINQQRHFVILTKEANSSMSPFHHRMPVILNSNDVPKWINTKEDITFMLSNSSPTLTNSLVEG